MLYMAQHRADNRCLGSHLTEARRGGGITNNDGDLCPIGLVCKLFCESLKLGFISTTKRNRQLSSGVAAGEMLSDELASETGGSPDDDVVAICSC